MRLWFDELASYGRVKHGLAGALNSVVRQTLADEGYTSILDAVTLLFDAGERAGIARHDVDAEWTACARPRPNSRAA